MTDSITLTNPNLSLSNEAYAAAIEILQTLLADEMILAQKLRQYRWNVTGTPFKALYEQYNVLSLRVDGIAERIWTYGVAAKGTLTEFIVLTRLQEHHDVNPNVRTLVNHIVEDHDALVNFLNADMTRASDNQDVVLVEFLTTVQQMHQQMAWMLRTSLERGDV